MTDRVAEFIVAHVVEFIVALVLAFIAAFVIERHGGWRARIRRFLEVRKTGLRAVFTRNDTLAQEQLRKLLTSSKSGDRVLIVGRTHLKLFQENGDAIEKALSAGARLEVLLLNLAAIGRRGPVGRIDLRSLRIPDADVTLSKDLGVVERTIRSLRDKCHLQKWNGSLLVHRTTIVVQSSAVIHVPDDPKAALQILYDLSFGNEPSTKFVQYYRISNPSASSFCGQLRSFYAGMFDQETSSFAYDLSYRPATDGNPQAELERIAAERARAIVGKHRESEAVRANSLDRLVPQAVPVFHALSHHTKPPAPLSAQIELTNECSTACAHCNRFTPSDDPEMNQALAERLLTELSELGVRTVTFSGGEPTRHSHFSGLLRYASDKDLGVGVLSNGVGLSKDVIRTIHERARWLRLSVDGSSAHIYNEVRRSLPKGADAFRDVKETIRTFAKLNDDSHSCNLAICYTIQRANADDVPDMIRWVQRLGLPGGDGCLTFKFAHGHNGFLCSQQQIEKLQRDVFSSKEFEQAANIPYLRWFIEHQTGIHNVAEGHPTRNLYEQNPTRCFTPHLFTLIAPQGDVYPCCFLFDDNGGYTESAETARLAHRLGSLKDNKSFKEIWEGPEYRRMRDELAVINPTDKYSPCGECTRHCNHNRWLTKLHEEYDGLRTAGGDGDRVLNEVFRRGAADEVWL